MAYNDCIQEAMRNMDGTESASIDVFETLTIPTSIDVLETLTIPTSINVHETLSIPSRNQSIDISFVGQSEEIINNVHSEEQLIVPDALPFVEFQEEIKTLTSKPTIPKIKIKTLEELQNSQTDHKIKQNEFYMIPEDVNNSSLQYTTAQNIHPPNEKLINSVSSNANAIFSIKDKYLESSENKMKLQAKNLKIRKKELLLRERLKKVLEMQAVMGMCHSKKNIKNVPAVEKSEPLNFVDVNDNPTLAQWASESVSCDENWEETQNKTVDEVDISGLKDGIIEASRTLISTQKSLKLMAQMLSNDIYLNDKHTANLLNQFTKIVRSFHKKFDKIQRTVKNQFRDVISQNDINDLLKIIEGSTPLVSPGIKAENKKRPSQVPKVGAKPYEISINKIVDLHSSDVFRDGVQENLNVPSSIAGEKTYKDIKNTFSPVLSSVKSEAKISGIMEWNCHRYEGEKNKSTKVGRPPKEKTHVEKEKYFRVIRPPREESKEKKYVEKKKYSRVGRPSKELTKEEKSDKTFCLPGLSRQVDTALKRVVPARSCRQLQSYLNMDELYFEPDCNT